MDGFARATQNIVQGFSGVLADRLQKRKSVALVGYFLAAIAKPLMGLSSVWQGVFGARFLDRLGAGTRSAPRDALIASSGPFELLQAENVSLKPGKCRSQQLRTSLQRNRRFRRQVQALQVECRNRHGFDKDISEKRANQVRAHPHCSNLLATSQQFVLG